MLWNGARPEQAAAGIWSRPYVMALAANFLIFFVVMSFVLFPLYIKEEGGSDTEIGLVMGVFSVVSVLLRPAAGLLADRFSYRGVTIFGLLVVAATVPFFALVEGRGLPVLLLRGLMGAGWSCILSPLMALATRLTPADRLAESLGIYGISGLVANAAAPVIGEWVVARSGYPILFLIDGALAVAALLLVGAIRSPADPAWENNHETPAEAAGGEGALKLAIAGTALLTVAHGAMRGVNINFIGPLAAESGLSAFSPFFVAFTLAALLTRFRLAALPDRLGRRRVAIPAALLIAANTLLISQVRSLFLLIVAGLLGGLAQGLIFPALGSLMVDLLGHHRRAFALSVYGACFETGYGLGLPAFGMVADALGYRWMYAAATLVMALVTLAFAVLVRPRVVGSPAGAS